MYTDSFAFNSKYTTDIHFEYTLDCQIINRIFGKGNYRVISVSSISTKETETGQLQRN